MSVTRGVLIVLGVMLLLHTWFWLGALFLSIGIFAEEREERE